MGVAVHFRDDGPDPLRQDHRPLRGHRPPLPVGVAFRGEIRKQGMGAVNELSHAARLLGKGANRPEVRGELGADRVGQRFLRGGRGQIHTAACRKDLPCLFIKTLRLVNIFRADRHSDGSRRINPDGIAVHRSPHLHGEDQAGGGLYGMQRKGHTARLRQRPCREAGGFRFRPGDQPAFCSGIRCAHSAV